MNRREFLQLTAASMGLLLVPEAFAVTKDIGTVSDLTEYIESRFKCSVGSPGPFITQEMNSRTDLWESFPLEMKYSTICFAMDEKDPIKAEKSLVQYAKSEFSKIQPAEIVWRVKPEFESMMHYEFGDHVISLDKVQDGEPIPEGTVLDVSNDSYRVVLNTYHMNRVRMRIASPTARDQFKHLFMQDGDSIRKAIRI